MQCWLTGHFVIDISFRKYGSHDPVISLILEKLLWINLHFHLDNSVMMSCDKRIELFYKDKFTFLGTLIWLQLYNFFKERFV